jgi:hypothetical protein
MGGDTHQCRQMEVKYAKQHNQPHPNHSSATSTSFSIILQKIIKHVADLTSSVGYIDCQDTTDS